MAGNIRTSHIPHMIRLHMQVTLLSSDNEKFEVLRDVALMSETVKNFLDGTRRYRWLCISHPSSGFSVRPLQSGLNLAASYVVLNFTMWKGVFKVFIDCSAVAQTVTRRTKTCR